MRRHSILLLLALLAASDARAQETPVIAFVVAEADEDTDRSCFWPLEGTSGLCYLEALRDDPVSTCLWTGGMVGLAMGFLYLSDTICGTPNAREQGSLRLLSEPSPEPADVLVRALPLMRSGVGAGDALYRVEARDARSGAPLPLDALGRLHVTVRESDLPEFLSSLRTP